MKGDKDETRWITLCNNVLDTLKKKLKFLLRTCSATYARTLFTNICIKLSISFNSKY